MSRGENPSGDENWGPSAFSPSHREPVARPVAGILPESLRGLVGDHPAQQLRKVEELAIRKPEGLGGSSTAATSQAKENILGETI